MAPQMIDDGADAVVAADAKVVALGDVVGEHDLGVLADAGEGGEQDVALQVLRLVDDDERVGDRSSPDMGQRHDLEQVTMDDLVDDLWPGDRLQRVGDRRSPRRHLLGLGAGEVSDVLPADAYSGRKTITFEWVRFSRTASSGSERKHALAGAGTATERHDADRVIGEQIEGDVLLSRAGPDVEHGPVGDAMDLLVLSHAAEARLRAGDQRDAGVDREIPSLVQVDHTFVVELVDDGALDREIGEAGPAAVGDLGVAVLGGVKPTTPALRRSGRSLVTRVTSSPSRARLCATVRIRWSLASIAALRAVARWRCG